MPLALILLIGEQPAANLLPTRYLRPDIAVLVHTERTKAIAERLQNVLEGGSINCVLLSVDPYDLPAIRNDLQQFIQTNFKGHNTIFNLTGGTKIMSLAAFQVVSEFGTPFVYFQTEGGRSLLYRYRFTEQKDVQLQEQKEIPGSITLDDYLRVQVGKYTTAQPRDPFEQQIHQTLRTIPGLEILASVRPQNQPALEVDFLIRLDNQIGVIEAKKKGAKSGIDQLQAVAEQRYLGTYVFKFLVSADKVDDNNKNLAAAYGIEVIELTSFKLTNGSLSKEDEDELKQRIMNILKLKRHGYGNQSSQRP
ncbi:MAG TPA: DUF1887 domain-containing protein [Chloroflexus aurantiacus]|uniref:Card1 CARF domain-containing protein n=1 Tax=Chloroflexus aurantiacus (strain ATCC 29366 / DSM 635 / J-10-fl) TaxID=324602 RepID=A9WGH9_CHLAA|nr:MULTISPECIES: DUF1887 family CARF protein [Chloroflexus]ABY35511.1 conserved hypothetical protein [Chloroflexus aurantiacus J-10-fl]GIV92045.1 MAG: hypothetical protein KatS3mg056_0754 [Chloroflexus sp.]HBW69464.1 DUF1887 domain-containing protein [Chloroflexus aurantiacus]